MASHGCARRRRSHRGRSHGQKFSSFFSRVWPLRFSFSSPIPHVCDPALSGVIVPSTRSSAYPSSPFPFLPPRHQKCTRDSGIGGGKTLIDKPRVGRPRRKVARERGKRYYCTEGRKECVGGGGRRGGRGAKSATQFSFLPLRFLSPPSSRVSQGLQFSSPPASDSNCVWVRHRI